MNPLTQIKNTQKVSRQEIAQGVSDAASWHAKFKHSAYVFAGGLTYGLTEGDLLAVFSQYGEIVDVNLVKDKDTGKSRGFAFLAYEDQRSTVLAVDNLSGAKVAGRTIKVDHVDNYKRKRAEMEGREESSSEEEADEEPDEAANEAAVLASAAADGAEIVSAAAATARGQTDAGANEGAGDDPWANSNSIFSLLSGPAPSKPSRPDDSALLSALQAPAGHKDKKEKKEKKEKKDKSHKEHKHRKHKADKSQPTPEPPTRYTNPRTDTQRVSAREAEHRVSGHDRPRDNHAREARGSGRDARDSERDSRRDRERDDSRRDRDHDRPRESDGRRHASEYEHRHHRR